MLETGDITRFKRASHYASYCRTVDSTRTSNGKIKGQGNAKAGNKYLSWEFSEAAHFCVRFDPLAQRFYQRKKAKNQRHHRNPRCGAETGPGQLDDAQTSNTL
jgi:transposase